MTQTPSDPAALALAALDSPDPARRIDALGILTRQRHVNAAPLVLALLRDPDPAVRAAAQAYFAALPELDTAQVVLAVLLAKAAAALGADRGYAAQLRTDGSLAVKATKDFVPSEADRAFQLSQNVTAEVTRTQQAILTSNAEADPRFGEQSIVTYALRSIAAVPLLLGDAVAGVIYLDKRVRQGLISPEDLAALQRLAAEASQELAAIGLPGKPEKPPAYFAPEPAGPLFEPDWGGSPEEPAPEQEEAAEGTVVPEPKPSSPPAFAPQTSPPPPMPAPAAPGGPTWDAIPASRDRGEDAEKEAEADEFDDGVVFMDAPEILDASDDKAQPEETASPPAQTAIDQRAENIAHLTQIGVVQGDVHIHAPDAPQTFFEASYPQQVAPAVWQPLYAYIYKAHAADAVRNDILDRQREHHEVDFGGVARPARAAVPEGTTIMAALDLPGFEVQTPAPIRYHRDWHRMDFQIKAGDDAAQGRASNGALRFYALHEGLPVLVGELFFEVTVATRVAAAPPATAAGQMFRYIFFSLDDADLPVYERLKAAYDLLQITCLRAQRAQAREVLLTLLAQADSFHLLWSAAAAHSPQVMAELQAALALAAERPRFIRPVYWLEPPPALPPELAGALAEYKPQLAG